jgi:hypothetical protein
MTEGAPEQPVETPGETNIWRQRSKRAAASLTGGLLAALPFTAAYAISNTEVHDDVGALPATVSLAPGHSSVDTGFGGKLYNDNFANHTIGIGADIQIEGPPNDLSGLVSGNPKEAIIPFVGLYQKPNEAAKGYEQALVHELKDELLRTELGGGLAAGALLFTIATAARELSPRRRKQLLAYGIGGLTIISSLEGNLEHQQWLQKHQEPAQTYPIAGTEDTTLEGTVADNELLTMGIGRVVPFIQQEKEREKKANEEFLQTAKETIDTALDRGDFTPPESGEIMVLALSDLHSNHDMISVYRYLVEKINTTYGKDTIQLAVSAGDNTYGSASEGDAIQDMAKITEQEKTINGNHDGTITESFEDAAGVDVLKGKTEEADNGLKVLGGDDPSLTKLQALFGFGGNVSRTGNDETEAEAGEKLKEEALKDKPDIMEVHEAYELEPIIDKDDISQATMDEWFEDSSQEAGPASATATPPEIPANLVVYGHWHRGLKYKVLKYSSGEWSVVAELGTAGGASGSMSLSTISTPWTTPAKEASAVFFTFGSESGLVNKIQEFNTSVSGEAAFRPTHNILSAYGPAPVSASTALGKGSIKPSPTNSQQPRPEAARELTR